MIDIFSEFSKSGLVLDKTTQSLSSLPYSFYDLKIKANDYVTDGIFNDMVKKLHYNFLYIFRGCNVGNFEVFDAYYYTLSSITTDPFYKRTENGYNLTKPNNSILRDTFRSVLLPYNSRVKSSYLFAINPTSIICYKTGVDVTDLVFVTNNVDPLSGDIKFKNIVDIKTDNKDNLYIVDSVYSSIYQYNINSFVSNEFIYREKLFLKNLIGGVGTVSENNKFSNIKNVAINDNILVAQDAGNKCFKVFDKNLNWLNTNVFNNVFTKVGYFRGIVLDPDNNLYCGVDNFIYKFRFLPDLNYYEVDSVTDIRSYFEEGEYITNLHLVPSDKNLFFIETNFSIKKVWFTSLDYVIGQFDYNRKNNADKDFINIKWMSISKFDNERDILALYSYFDSSNPNNRKENLSINLDKTYFNSLFNFENFNIYSLEESLINKEEYIQSWVILSKLSKLYYNLFILIQNLKYKYNEIPGSLYPIIERKTYNKGFLGFLDDLNYESDFEIGINEIFQSEVLNRAILQIYNLQLTILLYIVNNQNNIVYLSPFPDKGDPVSKQYVYFADDSFILRPNPSTLNIFEEVSPGAGILTSFGGAPLRGDETITISEGVNI
jgi:hypothetical protein